MTSFEQRLSQLGQETRDLFHHKLRICLRHPVNASPEPAEPVCI